MPELPDVSVYVEALQTRVVGHQLVRAIVKSPFLLRSTAPPISATAGKTVREVRRVGKQIAIGVEGDLWLVLHLMIAGRLHWKSSAPKLGSRNILVAFEFDNGWLWLTEAGTQRRAALRVVDGRSGSAVSERRRYRAARREPRRVRRGAALGESHAEALAHRPAHFQRHRQCVLRRDSASRTTLADRDDAEAD